MGGILALVLAFGIVFGAHKLCDLIRAPRWFAKFLFICAALNATYVLAEGVVPESKKSWGIWVAMLGAASGIIPVGFIMFKHIEEEGEDNRKAGDSPHPTPSRTNQHCDQLDERQLQEPQGDGGAPKINH